MADTALNDTDGSAGTAAPQAVAWCAAGVPEEVRAALDRPDTELDVDLQAAADRVRAAPGARLLMVREDPATDIARRLQDGGTPEAAVADWLAEARAMLGAFRGLRRRTLLVRADDVAVHPATLDALVAGTVPPDPGDLATREEATGADPVLYLVALGLVRAASCRAVAAELEAATTPLGPDGAGGTAGPDVLATATAAVSHLSETRAARAEAEAARTALNAELADMRDLAEAIESARTEADGQRARADAAETALEEARRSEAATREAALAAQTTAQEVEKLLRAQLGDLQQMTEDILRTTQTETEAAENRAAQAETRVAELERDLAEAVESARTEADGQRARADAAEGRAGRAETRVAELERDLAEAQGRAAHVSRLETALEAERKRHAEAIAAKKAESEKHAEQARATEDLRRDGAAKDAEIARLRDELKAAHARIDDLQRSTSWKVTAPVRFVGRTLKHD